MANTRKRRRNVRDIRDKDRVGEEGRPLGPFWWHCVVLKLGVGLVRVVGREGGEQGADGHRFGDGQLAWADQHRRVVVPVQHLDVHLQRRDSDQVNREWPDQ